MANNRTITSANSILLLQVAGLFATPVRIQGFAADDLSDTDAIEPAETMMGIDGRLSAGFVPVPVNQNVTLMADSQSNDFFDEVIAAQEQARELYVFTGSLVLPATGKKYAMTRGFLVNVVKFPAVKRSLQARRFALRWERVTVAAK
jgi:hypothetical protein